MTNQALMSNDLSIESFDIDLIFSTRGGSQPKADEPRVQALGRELWNLSLGDPYWSLFRDSKLDIRD
jgi:hypothetical protein